MILALDCFTTLGPVRFRAELRRYTRTSGHKKTFPSFPGRSSLRQRDLAVDPLNKYVRSTSAPTSELAQLCRIASVSERTLQYAFKERYGIPPNVYVKRWNLNTARRLLLQADSADTGR